MCSTLFSCLARRASLLRRGAAARRCGGTGGRTDEVLLLQLHDARVAPDGPQQVDLSADGLNEAPSAPRRAASPSFPDQRSPPPSGGALTAERR